MRRRRGNSMKKILQCILAVLAVLAGCVHQEVFGEKENIPVEISFKKDDETPKVWGLWFPPSIPENGGEPEPENALEDFVRRLEGEPVIRLVCITAPFLSIPAAIIAIYRLLKRKKQEE